MFLLILLLRHRFFSFIKSWSQFPCFGIQVAQMDWEPEAQYPFLPFLISLKESFLQFVVLFCRNQRSFTGNEVFLVTEINICVYISDNGSYNRLGVQIEFNK